MVGVIALVYLLCLSLFIMIRNSDKKRNPKYSFRDDFLLFTGSPVLLAYIMVIGFNPNNASEHPFDLFVTPFDLCCIGMGVSK